MENYIQWKTTFEEKETQMKGDLWWKMTFDGRQSLTRLGLQCQTPALSKVQEQ